MLHRIRHRTCGGEHSNVDEVRACDLRHRNNGSPSESRRLNADSDAHWGGEAVVRRERAEDERVAAYKAARDDRLHDLPLRTQFRQLAERLPSLKNARYAIDIDDTLKFYRVDKPQDGRWKGYTFIKVQASDELYPVKALESQVEILREIAKDPQQAMLRYGQEIGSCGHCGRTLTNEESRAIGIGPICRGKMGWMH